MPEVLFIGGPKDGHRLVLRELRPWFTAIESIHASASTCHLREAPTLKTVEYRLMSLGEGDQRLVYVVKWMTADMVMGALLADYHPSKEPVADALAR